MQSKKKSCPAVNFLVRRRWSCCWPRTSSLLWPRCRASARSLGHAERLGSIPQDGRSLPEGAALRARGMLVGWSPPGWPLSNLPVHRAGVGGLEPPKTGLHHTDCLPHHCLDIALAPCFSTGTRARGRPGVPIPRMAAPCPEVPSSGPVECRGPDSPGWPLLHICPLPGLSAGCNAP